MSVSARARAPFFRTYPIVLRINPASTMMIAMTTSNSTRLNAVVVAGVSPAIGRILQPARSPLQARSCAEVVEAFMSNAWGIDNRLSRCTRQLCCCKPWMMLIRGVNSASTIVPTMTARKTIMIGSSAAVMPATALSTSSSYTFAIFKSISGN